MLTIINYAVLGIVTVIGAVICFGSIVLLHMLPTGYDPIRNAVSDYGVGPYRIWHRTALVALAAAAFALAIASAGSIKPEPVSVIGFLVAFGVVRIIISLFPTDIEGRPPTRTGRIHMALAIVAFACVASAAGFFQGTAIDNIVGRVVVATAACLLVGIAWSRLKPIFGLLERLCYLAMIGWFLVIGIELIQLATAL
jgi:Protein of unknown function (DUF998)